MGWDGMGCGWPYAWIAGFLKVHRENGVFRGCVQEMGKGRGLVQYMMPGFGRVET
jgi:hypothetical protein